MSIFSTYFLEIPFIFQSQWMLFHWNTIHFSELVDVISPKPFIFQSWWMLSGIPLTKHLIETFGAHEICYIDFIAHMFEYNPATILTSTSSFSTRVLRYPPSISTPRPFRRIFGTLISPPPRISGFENSEKIRAPWLELAPQHFWARSAWNFGIFVVLRENQ